jgi:hypothetical protein
MRAIDPLALVVMLAVAGCSALAPTGKNTASFPAYKMPDENGQLELEHTPTEAGVASASFRLTVPDDVAKRLELDPATIEGQATACTEAEDGDLCAVFDTTSLPAGFYPIEIFEAGTDGAVASTTLLVKATPAPAEDVAASETGAK